MNKAFDKIISKKPGLSQAQAQDLYDSGACIIASLAYVHIRASNPTEAPSHCYTAWGVIPDNLRYGPPPEFFKLEAPFYQLTLKELIAIVGFVPTTFNNDALLQYQVNSGDTSVHYPTLLASVSKSSTSILNTIKKNTELEQLPF